MIYGERVIAVEAHVAHLNAAHGMDLWPWDQAEMTFIHVLETTARGAGNSPT